MKKDGFSQTLRTKIELVSVGFFKKEFKLKQDMNNKKWFVSFLFTIHSMIRASVPLMEFAMEKLGSKQDNVSSKLREYFGEHSKEECNHDLWILQDLETIGINRKTILHKKPSLLVAELVGSQYYWINHWHPVTLLGYISIMEGFPPEKNYLESMEKKLDLPHTALRTLYKHSILDVEHRDDLNNLLDDLPINTTHKIWITENAFYTLSKTLDIFAEINKNQLN